MDAICAFDNSVRMEVINLILVPCSIQDVELHIDQIVLDVYLNFVACRHT
jgi:hypothetical protein